MENVGVAERRARFRVRPNAAACRRQGEGPGPDIAVERLNLSATGIRLPLCAGIHFDEPVSAEPPRRLVVPEG